jgi:hypothetical protein
MVIVVFGDEEQVVHQSHGLLQSRMEQTTSDLIRSDLLGSIHQLPSCFSKLRQNLLKRPRIVIGLGRSAIGQVSNAEFASAAQEVLDSFYPQSLEVKQMARVLLGLPFLFSLLLRLSDQNRMRTAPQHLLQPCRSATQAHANIRILPDRKGEFKFSVKPERDCAHHGLRS